MMEFLIIIGVATIALFWMFWASSDDKRQSASTERDFPSGLTISPPLKQPEVWQALPMDEVEYFQALELYDHDPVHNPCPSPPSHRSSADFSCEE